MLLRLTLHLDRYIWTAENHFCVPPHYVSSFTSLDPTPSCPLSHIGKKMSLSPPSSHFFFHFFSSSIPPVSDLCGLSSKDRTVNVTEHVGWLVVNLQRYCWGVSLSDCETGLWRTTVGPECKWKNGKKWLSFSGWRHAAWTFVLQVLGVKVVYGRKASLRSFLETLLQFSYKSPGLGLLRIWTLVLIRIGLEVNLNLLLSLRRRTPTAVFTVVYRKQSVSLSLVT